MMPTVRTIRVYETETVEIQWTRKIAEGQYQTLIERHTAPPTATWNAKLAQDAKLAQQAETVGWSEKREKSD